MVLDIHSITHCDAWPLYPGVSCHSLNRTCHLWTGPSHDAVWCKNGCTGLHAYKLALSHRTSTPRHPALACSTKVNCCWLPQTQTAHHNNCFAHMNCCLTSMQAHEHPYSAKHRGVPCNIASGLQRLASSADVRGSCFCCCFCCACGCPHCHHGGCHHAWLRCNPPVCPSGHLRLCFPSHVCDPLDACYLRCCRVVDPAVGHAGCGCCFCGPLCHHPAAHAGCLAVHHRGPLVGAVEGQRLLRAGCHAAVAAVGSCFCPCLCSCSCPCLCFCSCCGLDAAHKNSSRVWQSKVWGWLLQGICVVSLFLTP